MTFRAAALAISFSLFLVVPLSAQDPGFQFPNSKPTPKKPPKNAPVATQPAPAAHSEQRPDSATARPAEATPPPQVKLPPGFPPMPAEKSVRVWGNTIRYFDTGAASGPVVVLVHGFGSAKEDWLPLLPNISPQLRIIALDQIGFGRSDKPLLNYRVGTLTDFLDEFLSQLKVERATLVGSSMGGWVSALYAVQHPARVDKLVLIDSAGYSLPKDVDPKTLDALNPSTREATRKLTEFIMAPGFPVTDAMVDFAYLRRMSAGDGYTIRTLTESLLRGEDTMDQAFSKIAAPTLLVWGEKDQFLSLDIARRLQAQIAGSKLVTVANAGHLPQIDHPADAGRVISEFIGAK